MTTHAVVDASVALKWVVTEPGSEEADALLDQLAEGAVSLLAPEHLIGEVGNGLRKRVAQGVLSGEDAIEALDAIAALELTYVSGADRWFRCLAAALEWGVTTYDALYILLAGDFHAELVTADTRLGSVVVPVLVKVLGNEAERTPPGLTLGDRGPAPAAYRDHRGLLDPGGGGAGPADQAGPGMGNDVHRPAS